MHVALLSAAVVLLLVFVPQPVTAQDSQPEPPNTFTYTAPGDIQFEITADGLSGIRAGERQLAEGGWSVFNAEGWFQDGGSQVVDTKELTDKTLEVLDDRHARVRHLRGDVDMTADYTFDGEDVLISARVVNNHPTEPMRVVGFSGLKFEFDELPEGYMLTQHISYFQAHGVGLCHPGHWAKVGGSWAVDRSCGVGVSPWNTGLCRTMILWDYGSWAQDARDKSPARRLLYFAVAEVPSRGARTFDLKLRVSRNREWQHLLAPYREHFRTTFGPARYKPDYRWVASEYMNHSQQVVSEENPYGFHGGYRRLDLKEGADEFCNVALSALEEGNGQGIILWGFGGDDPRRAMYRPDFDVMPPEVEANWAILKRRFQQAGKKLGVCTRPRHLAVRATWEHDRIIDINPDDPGHVTMLWQRFDNMIQRGCTLFYLDSFGNSFEDVKLMRRLREKMGPGILTFAEHQCDAILPYSGAYSETSFHPQENDRPAGYRVWSGLTNWEIYRYLVPEAQMISRLYTGEDKIPTDFEPATRFFYRNHITPLIPLYQYSRRRQLIERFQPDFVDGQGQWRQ